jgi:thiol-disulfide isomerase/thioredoxin
LGVLIGLAMISPVFGQDATSAEKKAQDNAASFDPAAVSILNETFKVYRECRSYQDKVRLTVTMLGEKDDASAASEKKTRSFDSQLIFERPNKILFVWPSVTLNCDGKQCQVYYPDLQQYTVREAPAEMTRAYLEPLLMENFMTIVLNGLTSETPFEDSMKGKAHLEYKQKVAKSGVEYHRLQYIDGGDLVEVLISTKDKLIHGMTIKPQDPKKQKWQLELDYSQVSLNAPISAEKFAIQEPVDARKVDRISFTREYEYPKLGQKVPDFALSLWKGGKEKKAINDLLGEKVTLVTFWASWCMPCRGELPILESLYGQYKDKGLMVIGVNLESSDKQGAMNSFLDESKFSFPILLDPQAFYAKELLVQSLPTLLVLDSKGKIVECHVGTSPDVQRELRSIVQGFIGEDKKNSAGTAKTK